MNANVQANSSVQHLPSPQLPIRNYNEFYRFYLTEHRNITSRRLHVLGSVIGGYWIAKAIRHRKPKYVLYGFLYHLYSFRGGGAGLPCPCDRFQHLQIYPLHS